MKAEYTSVVFPFGLGRLQVRSFVRDVNLFQSAFRKFHLFLFREEIFISIFVPMMIGQCPDRGNLSRMVRSQLGAMFEETKLRSGFVHCLCRPEKKVW